MKRIKQIAVYSFCTLLVAFTSCDSNKNRRDNFEEQRIVTDSDGNKWIVKHNIGDIYVLQPMPKK